ncbi:MAG: hypothetical protein ACQEQV_06025 [Fibrobacterota bacterium]
MNETMTELIDMARKKYNSIKPCGGYNNLDECFTQEEGKLFFWFNTQDKSTHALCKEIT